jgi:hypothetical protein
MHKQNMPNLDELNQLWSFRLNVVDIERLINKDPMAGHCACWILCNPFTIRVQQGSLGGKVSLWKNSKTGYFLLAGVLTFCFYIRISLWKEALSSLWGRTIQFRMIISSMTDTSLPRIVMLWLLIPFLVTVVEWPCTGLPSTRAHAPIRLSQPTTACSTQLPDYSVYLVRSRSYTYIHIL